MSSDPHPASPVTVHVISPPRGAPRRVGVEVTGEIDLATAPILAARLHAEIDRGRDHLVVSLRRVRFCGLAGLDVLDEARARATRRGGHLSIADVSSPVRRLLALVARIGVAFPLVALAPSPPAPSGRAERDDDHGQPLTSA